MNFGRTVLSTLWLESNYFKASKHALSTINPHKWSVITKNDNQCAELVNNSAVYNSYFPLTRSWIRHLSRFCDGVSQQWARGHEQEGPGQEMVTLHHCRTLLLEGALILTEVHRWKRRLVHAPSVPTGLYSSSCSLPHPPPACHTAVSHTHTLLLATIAISSMNSLIPSNCHKSTGSHRWIIGSIKRQVPWPMFQGHSHVLPALQLDWLFLLTL